MMAGMAPRTVALALALAAGLAAAAPAHAAGPLDLRLSTDRRTLVATANDRATFVDGAVLVTAHGSPLELQAARDASGRILVAQRTPAGMLPTAAASATFSRGLAGFLHYQVLRADGSVALEGRRAWCPNAFDGDYPGDCGYVLARSVVWGLGAGKEVDADLHLLAGGLAPATYRLEVALDPDGVLPAQVRGNDALAVALRVRRERGRRLTALARRRPAPAAFARRAGGAPPQGGLPDLAALPPAHVELEGSRLAFDSMIANLGTGPLIVRGTGRRTRGRRQAAEQVLLGRGRIVARRPAGEMETNERRGHDGHWHYRDAARYRLRDAAGRVVARSGKVGFCLMNTDQVDLHFGRPPWTLSPPDRTTCRGRRPQERLDPGWGDRYLQVVAGQALNVRRLPNGTYTLEVEVNPAGRLTEVTAANNLAGRPVVLGGEGRGRTLQVPPVGGVDTVAELAAASELDGLFPG